MKKLILYSVFLLFSLSVLNAMNKVNKKSEDFFETFAEKNLQIKLMSKKTEIDTLKEEIKEEEEKFQYFKNFLGESAFNEVVEEARKNKEYDKCSIFLTKDTVDGLIKFLKKNFDHEFCETSRKPCLMSAFKNMHLARCYILRKEKCSPQMFSLNSDGANMVEKKLLPKWLDEHEKHSSRDKLLLEVKKLKSRMENDYKVLKQKEDLFKKWKKMRIVSFTIEQIINKLEYSVPNMCTEEYLEVRDTSEFAE